MDIEIEEYIDSMACMGIKVEVVECLSGHRLAIRDAMSEIVVPSFISEICTATTSYSREKLERVILNSGLKFIAEYTFNGCGLLKYIVIPDTVLSVGDYTFKDCGELVDVKLGARMEEITSGMFKACSSLNELNIGNNIKNIGGW